MPIEDELTYLQKVALKGEIAFTLSTAAHDTEMKYRIYLVLKEVESKYRPYVLQCMKEAVTFDPEVIDRIYLEVLNGNIPLWLWIEEVIADIKIHLGLNQPELTSISVPNKLSIDKKQERKHLIESSFLDFTRRLVLVCPKAIEELISKILEDNDLEFLSNACFYLQSCCEEIKQRFGDDQEPIIPKTLMKEVFSIKEGLSFVLETKALDVINNKEANSRSTHQILTPKEFTDFLDQQILSIFKNPPCAPSSTTTDTVYVVKKVFTDSGLSTDIRICRTEEEAINFIKKIISEYPELSRTCEFQVYSTKNYENQKGTKKKG